MVFPPNVCGCDIIELGGNTLKKILIKNGYVIDPGSERKGYYDILIEGEKVERVEEEITCGKNVDIIDAEGKIVVPGFIDLQVNPGNTIEYICEMLPSCGITTPLIMPCNVNGIPFLDYYGGLRGVIDASGGQRVNVANAISVEPPDTGAHETYMQLAVPLNSIKSRIEEFIELGITAVGEVVLPLGGTAHITTSMSEEFLDKLLNETERHDMPILLHTGLGLHGIEKAVEVSNGRRMHICHVGSTCSQDSIHKALVLLSENGNITSDTHLSEVAGSNSRNSKLVVEYFDKGQAVHIDAQTLKVEKVEDINKARPPFYYNKVNLFENNIICALSEQVDAIESDDLGDGIRSKILLKNLFKLVNCVALEHVKHELMYKMIKKLTINPAKILKINRGTLGEGAFADAVILDLHNERVETVMVNGKIVLFNGKLTGEKGGKRIRFKS